MQSCQCPEEHGRQEGRRKSYKPDEIQSMLTRHSCTIQSVAIYLPMVPEAAVAFLACARLGAVHSVVFAGFSSESLRDRINDCGSKVLITTDEAKRGGKTIATKTIVDAALKEAPVVEHCLVLRRTGANVPMVSGRDVWWHEECAKQSPYCPVEIVNSEHPLFILYTSGSTGKPKGKQQLHKHYLHPIV